MEVHELDSGSKVSFATDAGPITFKRDREAARDVRELVMRGLRDDVAYRKGQQRFARIMIVFGLTALIVCGGLFGLYCWWASRAPDPPPGHWIYYLRWLIRAALFLLLAVALAGPYAIYIALRQLNRIRRVERTLAAGSPSV